MSGNKDWKGNKSLYVLDVPILTFTKYLDVINITNTEEYWSTESLDLTISTYPYFPIPISLLSLFTISRDINTNTFGIPD